jgi:hypothetical protein
MPYVTMRTRTCRRWRWNERVVPVAEESCLPPRTRLDPAPVEPSIGVCGFNEEVRRQVRSPAPDLHGLLQIARGHGWDRHSVAANPLAVSR